MKIYCATRDKSDIDILKDTLDTDLWVLCKTYWETIYANVKQIIAEDCWEINWIYASYVRFGYFGMEEGGKLPHRIDTCNPYKLTVVKPLQIFTSEELKEMILQIMN